MAGLICGAALALPAHAASNAPLPDFSGPWARISLGYERPLSGPGPIENRNKRPNGASNLSALAGDYTDPRLKPEASVGELRLRQRRPGGSL